MRKISVYFVMVKKRILKVVKVIKFIFGYIVFFFYFEDKIC